MITSTMATYPKERTCFNFPGWAKHEVTQNPKRQRTYLALNYGVK